MKTIKSCAGFCFLIIAALFTLISCEFFIGSVPQYLKKYSEEIVVNNHHPQGPTQIDNTNTICFPSNYKEKFPYYVSYTNPRGKFADLVILDSEDSQMNWGEFLNKITYERVDDYAFVIYFHNDSFLQPKDKETTDRKVSYTFSFIDGEVPVQTGKFKVTFNVNTPPDIIDGELGLCKAVVNNSIRNIVCFNLKPQSLENIYGDLKNSDGKYPITIDGKTYYFTFDSNGVPVFDDGNFYRSLDDIPEASEFTVVNEFTQKQNPVYFVTNENLNKTYTISTKDNHGLVSPNYSISTKPSGNPQLVFTAQKINDYLIITPDFTARARKVGDTDISLTDEILTLKYKINDEDEKTYEFTREKSSPLNIYVPGGTSTVLCSMTCNSRNDIQNSDLVMETFNLPNAIYASWDASDFNENYKGGNASHRIKIKDAVDYVNTQTGSWTIYLKAGTYTAQPEDLTEVNGEKTYIYLKKQQDQSLNITLQGDSNSSRAVLNANGRARVIDNKTTSLTLRYVDITGGYIDTAGQDDNGVHGGGIKSTGLLTLENCDIYENKTLGNSSSGGGIHCSNNITLKNTKIHNNECKNHGGGIYIHTHEIILQGNNEIYENTANSHGGGINFYNTSYVELKSGVTSFTNDGKINGGLSVYKNKGSKGGGISFSEGAATISGVNIYDNENNGDSAEGVGIYSSGSLTLEYVYLNNNVNKKNNAKDAVYCKKNLTLQNKINLNTENIVIPPDSLTIIESDNNALKSDYISTINVKLKTDTDLVTLLAENYKEINGVDPWWVSKINSADSTYVFSNFRSKKLELVNKKRMVYSNSNLSTVVADVTTLNRLTEEDPGIILFAEDYTKDANTSGDLITFRTQTTPKKYIIYGNGKVLNANRNSTYNGHAILVNQNNDVEIRDFKEIRGGYTLKGGAIYIDNKGTVTLKNTKIGKAPPRKSNNELDLSLDWSEEIYNKARNGGGIYVCNGGRLIVEPDTDENSYTYFCKNFAADGNGSALYVEKGGLAQLNRCYFIYNGFNIVNNTHGTIYCEKDAKLEIGNTNIQRNYCAGGTAGIYLAGDASIKINEGLTVKKNFIPTGVLAGDPATAEAAGIHTNNSFFLSTFEYTEYVEGVNIPCIKNLELNNDMGLVDFNISQILYKDGTTDRTLNCIDSTKFFIKIFTYNGKAVSTARIGWKGSNAKNYYYDLQKDAVINTEYVQGILIQ